MTDLQHCEVRPGLLVEWTLAPPVIEAAGNLPADRRPPAYNQEMHITTARSVLDEDGVAVPTWLAVAFDIPGLVDLDVLQEALRAWTLRHETLRSGFRWVGGDLRRFTLDAASVSLRRQVVGAFSDAGQLVQHLQDRFDAAASALRWPNFIFAAVVRDGATSVYMAFDHSNIDAYSAYRIPAEVHGLYRAGIEGHVIEQVPVSSYVDFCEIEREAADQIGDTHSAVARWREFVHRCDGNLPNFPVDLGLEPGSRLPTQTLTNERLVDAEDAAAFVSHCRPLGGLVGVLAATSIVAHRVGGQRVFRTIVPFHTRMNSKWLHSVGWYVGGVPIEIPVSQAAEFGDVVERVRNALQAGKALSRIPIPRILSLLGSDFHPTSPDLYSIVSFADARAVPGSERWAELKAYGLVRVSYGDKVCVWFTRLHEGLQVATRYPDTDIAHKNMRLYVEQLRELILAVARNGLALPVWP